MACFVLIPGAGGAAWYWHRVVPLLKAEGHDVLAIELPADDEKAGLNDYADLVARALPKRGRVILVAHSLGGFTAPLVCARRSVDMLVLVNAMIPNPGETAEAWGDITGSEAARKNAAKRHGYSLKFEEHTYFFHDVPHALVKESAAHEHDEAPISFSTPCDFQAWPDIPTHVLVGKGDRLFPAEFQERIARERLHLGVDLVDGGHLMHLSNPEGVASHLLAHSA
jgi:pimeloyl-ACP methyl ester carboxylesterase